MNKNTNRYEAEDINVQQDESVTFNATSSPSHTPAVVNVNPSSCRSCCSNRMWHNTILPCHDPLLCGSCYSDTMWWNTIWMRHHPPCHINTTHYVLSRSLPPVVIEVPDLLPNPPQMLLTNTIVETQEKKKDNTGLILSILILGALMALAFVTICSNGMTGVDMVMRITLIIAGIGYVIAYLNDMVKDSHPGFIFAWISVTLASVILSRYLKNWRHIALSLTASSIIVIFLNIMAFGV